MLFGQSIFQSVLDRLEAEDESAETDEGPVSHRIRGLNTSFVSEVRQGVSAAYARPDQAYADNFGADLPPYVEVSEAIEPQPMAAPAQEPCKPSPIPQHLLRIRPQEVAEELAISSKDTVHSLSDRRRHFAKANHPDRVDPQFRDNATIRMKIANLLIDEAIRRLGIMTKLGSPRHPWP